MTEVLPLLLGRPGRRAPGRPRQRLAGPRHRLVAGRPNPRRRLVAGRPNPRRRLVAGRPNPQPIGRPPPGADGHPLQPVVGRPGLAPEGPRRWPSAAQPTHAPVHRPPRRTVLHGRPPGASRWTTWRTCRPFSSAPSVPGRGRRPPPRHAGGQLPVGARRPRRRRHRPRRPTRRADRVAAPVPDDPVPDDPVPDDGPLTTPSLTTAPDDHPGRRSS